MGEAAKKQLVAEAQAPQVMVVSTEADLRRLIGEAVAAAIAQQTSPARELMNATEAAEMLGIHPKSVTKYVKSEGLPGIKVGGHYRFRRADIIAWLEERAMKPGGHTKHIERLRRLR